MSLITLLNAHIAFGERPLLEGSAAHRPGRRAPRADRAQWHRQVDAAWGCSPASLHSSEGEVQRGDGLRVGGGRAGAAAARRGEELQRACCCAPPPMPRPGAPECRRRAEHWRMDSRLGEFLHRFGLTGANLPTCSGGERKRAALALAFTLQPDLLLLDEPTNHLDIEAIERLEELLLKVPATVVITHDRAFLDRVTTRIVELDRGRAALLPGTSPPTRSAKTRSSPQRTPRGVISKSSGGRRRSGSAKGWRLDARVTRGACAASSGCASNVPAPGPDREHQPHLEAGERSGHLVAELDR